MRTLALTLVTAAALSAQSKTPRTFTLQSHDARFQKLIDPAAKLETIAKGLGFTEGPVWDPRGFLYVSDEETNKILRIDRDGAIATVVSLGDPDGNTYDTQGRLIDCASVLRAIISVDPDGKYRVLADRFEGKRFNSPNDVVTGPDGAIYFTDPTLDLPKGESRDIPFQGVYRLASDGKVTLLLQDMGQPNGLAFSPDGKRFYVDDSERRDIRVYDFHAGKVSGGRQFAKQEGKGVPDGMRVDTNGNLYITGPDGIWVWSPDAVLLGIIVLPETAANLTWGDADYQTLYITASTSVYRLRTNATGFVPYLKK